MMEAWARANPGRIRSDWLNLGWAGLVEWDLGWAGLGWAGRSDGRDGLKGRLDAEWRWRPSRGRGQKPETKH
jgi:hypothetical protein